MNLSHIDEFSLNLVLFHQGTGQIIIPYPGDQKLLVVDIDATLQLHIGFI